LLLASVYPLLKNEHLRGEVLGTRFSRRTPLWIEIIGVLFCLLPACGLIMQLSWPFFVDAFVNSEQSSNAGRLTRWPAKLLTPIGFPMLVAAAVSHLISSVGCLLGRCPDPRDVHTGKSAEELLAEEITSEAQQREAVPHEGL